jgi:ABC-type transport system involved in cytochrome bd biosynthesis fused ATPase/permease subunit
VIIVFVTISGCGETKQLKSENQGLSTTVEQQKAQISNLQKDNNDLKAVTAKQQSDITGNSFIVIEVALGILVINNIIWLIAYKKKGKGRGPEC